MADADPFLSRIFDQLSALEHTLGGIRDDVTTLKANSRISDLLGVEVKEQGVRLTRLELVVAQWTGGATISGKVGSWAAGVFASLLVMAVAGLVGYFVHR